MEVVSLFSGAMGLDIGLENAGLETVICAEFDPSCRATISANRPKAKILEDVGQVTKDTAPMRPFLVAGGPPCQSFSTAGRRLAFSDPRGMLIYEFGRVVAELQPRFFLMENVKGLASAKVPWSSKTALEEILDNFASIGYKVVPKLLLAADYGVPQFRERVIIIGSRDQEDIFMPLPTHFSVHQLSEYRYRTLRHAIWDIRNDPGEHEQFTETRLKFLKKIPSGGNWKSLPIEEQKKAMGGAYLSGGGKMGFFRRLIWDEPSPTLVTSPVHKSTMLCHPDADRPLGINEYMAIQQFPKSWELKGNLSAKYRQLGNAVPIGLGAAIGHAIASLARNDYRVVSKRLKYNVEPKSPSKKSVRQVKEAFWK